MKMYEKLSMDTEAALKWIEECATRNCRECPAYKTQKFGDAATKCAYRYLLSDAPELPKIPRFMTAKTQEDLDRLFAEFDKYCTNTFLCKECRLNGNPGKGISDCYHAYLTELVDAPESEYDNGEA